MSHSVRPPTRKLRSINQIVLSQRQDADQFLVKNRMTYTNLKLKQKCLLTFLRKFLGIQRKCANIHKN